MKGKIKIVKKLFETTKKRSRNFTFLIRYIDIKLTLGRLGKLSKKH